MSIDQDKRYETLIFEFPDGWKTKFFNKSINQIWRENPEMTGIFRIWYQAAPVWVGEVTRAEAHKEKDTNESKTN